MIKTMTAAIVTSTVAFSALPMTGATAEPVGRQYGERCFSVSIYPNPVEERRTVFVDILDATPRTTAVVTLDRVSKTQTTDAYGEASIKVRAPGEADLYVVRVEAWCDTPARRVVKDYVLTVTPRLRPPGAPGNVRALRTDGFVTVTWSAPASGGPAEFYVIEVKRLKRDGDLSRWRLLHRSTSTALRHPTGNRVRKISVVAVNRAGRSQRAVDTLS